MSEQGPDQGGTFVKDRFKDKQIFIGYEGRVKWSSIIGFVKIREMVWEETKPIYKFPYNQLIILKWYFQRTLILKLNFNKQFFYNFQIPMQKPEAQIM